MPNLDFDPTNEEYNEKIRSFEIEYQDVFHLNNLYDTALRWFEENGFQSLEGDDQFETFYAHKVSSSGSVEHTIWWRAEMTPFDNPYYKYFLKMDFRTINMKTVQIQREGEQREANKGDIIIRVEGWILLDYNKTFRNAGFFATLHNYFKRKVYLDQVNQGRNLLWKLVGDLQATLKDFLELKNPNPGSLSEFHPKYGL